jgi:hypothetical protein
MFEQTNHKTGACPISYTTVDKHLIKLYSSIVLTVLIYTFITQHYLPMYLISIDFAIRVLIGIKYSPLCNLLTTSLKITPLKPLLVNAKTKKIAAQVGLLFCVLICIFHWLEFSLTSQIFIIMFMIAIFLDLFFDYCLACKMQSIVDKLKN